MEPACAVGTFWARRTLFTDTAHADAPVGDHGLAISPSRAPPTSRGSIVFAREKEPRYCSPAAQVEVKGSLVLPPFLSFVRGIDLAMGK